MYRQFPGQILSKVACPCIQDHKVGVAVTTGATTRHACSLALVSHRGIFKSSYSVRCWKTWGHLDMFYSLLRTARSGLVDKSLPDLGLERGRKLKQNVNKLYNSVIQLFLE